MFQRKTFIGCDDMPLYNFIKVLTTENLDFLLSDKNVILPKPNLNEAWEKIFLEYSERIGDKNSHRSFSLIKNIKLIENTLSISIHCINLLAKVNDISKFKPTIDILKSTLGVNCSFSEETFAKDVKVCSSRIKLLKIKYTELVNEYNSLSVGENKQATEKDFTDQIVILEETMGVPIDPKNISIGKYISYINRLKEKNKDGH